MKTAYLIDIEVLALGFIDLRFVKRHKIPIVELLKPIILRLANYKHTLDITHRA